MQNFRWLSLLVVFCLVSSVICGDTPVLRLLTDEDYDLEASLQEEGRPALRSELNANEQWESYNEWRCFPKSTVELTCVEIDYGGWRKSPVIIATQEGHRFEYDLDPTFKWDCDFTLNEWRRIVGDSSEVCLFGAYLQELNDDASLWVLSQFKSEHGYWKEYESEAYRYARRDTGVADDGREDDS